MSAREAITFVWIGHCIATVGINIARIATDIYCTFYTLAYIEITPRLTDSATTQRSVSACSTKRYTLSTV
jgi:hypothetical protein